MMCVLRCGYGSAQPMLTTHPNQTTMLYTIAAILIILWLLGVVGVYTIGWFIHILLVVAIVVVLIRVIRGENPI
jgi:hypothetical protein